MNKVFDLEKDGDEIVEKIKNAAWLPYKTGNLKNNAISGQTVLSNEVYWIRFDSQIAPYIQVLEEGRERKTKKETNSIYKMGTTMNRIGVPFHYGSETQEITSSPVRFGRHMGFISDKTINLILDYFVIKYNGEIR